MSIFKTIAPLLALMCSCHGAPVILKSCTAEGELSFELGVCTGFHGTYASLTLLRGSLEDGTAVAEYVPHEKDSTCKTASLPAVTVGCSCDDHDKKFHMVCGTAPKRGVRVGLNIASDDTTKAVAGTKELMPALELMTGGVATCLDVCLITPTSGYCLPCGGNTARLASVLQDARHIIVTIDMKVPPTLDNTNVKDTLLQGKDIIEDKLGGSLNEVTVNNERIIKERVALTTCDSNGDVSLELGVCTELNGTYHKLSLKSGSIEDGTAVAQYFQYHTDSTCSSPIVGDEVTCACKGNDLFHLVCEKPVVISSCETEGKASFHFGVCTELNGKYHKLSLKSGSIEDGTAVAQYFQYHTDSTCSSPIVGDEVTCACKGNDIFHMVCSVATRSVRVGLRMASSDMTKASAGSKQLMPALELMTGGVASCLNVCLITPNSGYCLSCGENTTTTASRHVAVEQADVIVVTVDMKIPVGVDNNSIRNKILQGKDIIEANLGGSLMDVTVNDLRTPGGGDDDDDLSTGAIVGIVLGSVAALVLVILLIYFFCLRSKQSTPAVNDPTKEQPSGAAAV